MPETLKPHTPVPWRVFHKSGITAILKGKKEVIHWQGFDSSHYPKQVLVNAQFIVRAVNSHDALVEALEDAVSNCGCCGGSGIAYTMEDEESFGQPTGSSGIDCPGCSMWRQALKAAKGE